MPPRVLFSYCQQRSLICRRAADATDEQAGSYVFCLAPGQKASTEAAIAYGRIVSTSDEKKVHAVTVRRHAQAPGVCKF